MPSGLNTIFAIDIVFSIGNFSSLRSVFFLYNSPSFRCSQACVFYRSNLGSYFTHAWEQRKLGEILEINQIPVPKPSSSYIRLGIRSHGKGTFHEQVEAGSGLAVDTMFKVETDNLIINITFAWELALAVTDAEDDGKLVSHRFPQYKFKSQYSPTFFKNLIYDKKFKSDLMLASPGGAGRNRVLKKSEFLDIERTVPKQIEEQTAIGNFFKQLDAAIASHQRKPVLQKASKIKQADTISACFWLAKSSQMPHHNIGILIFKFLNNMNISVLRGGHARMPEPSRHAGNRYPGKKQ